MKRSFPEARVLLACLSSRPLSHYVLAAMEDQRLSWQTMFHAANQLGVGPLLYYRLAALGLREYIPAEMARRRREELFSNQARNMKLYADVKRVLTALTGEGIQVCVLKGLALAEGVYDHIGLRTMGDVDILVRKKDLDKAACVIEELGFMSNETYREKAWYRDHHHHLVPYVSPDCSLTIEVHWHIIERTAFMDMPVDELWSHLKPVRIADVPCLALSPEHMLLHMALHISSPNRFLGQLRGLCDVAQLLGRVGEEMDWLEVLRIAKLAEANKHLYCVLRLVRDVFGTSVPDEIFILLRRQIVFVPLEERLIGHIALNAALTPPADTDTLYEWVFLDLVNHLLSQRPYVGICRDLAKQVATRWKMRKMNESDRTGSPELRR